MTSRDAETLGDRFLKLDLAGEHGAANLSGSSGLRESSGPEALDETAIAMSNKETS